MIFAKALIPGRLLKRYKRFLADVVLEDGSELTVHCPNTGAMLGCQEPGSRVWLSESGNPKRKYAYTWEIVETPEGVPVGINTQRSNALVAEALMQGLPADLARYPDLQREVSVADGRLDFRLSGRAGAADCFVEVKNVTAAVRDGVALFPDAKSDRARRHVVSLMAATAQGHQAAIVFCVQRSDVTCVEPARQIDPEFSEALVAAHEAGVSLFALGARVSPTGITLGRELVVSLPGL